MQTHLVKIIGLDISGMYWNILPLLYVWRGASDTLNFDSLVM